MLILSLVLSPLLFAETRKESRRIEEEKRKSLTHTEIPMAGGKTQEPQSTGTKQLSYFDKLISKKIASIYDGCIAVSILTGIDKKYKDIDSQINFLKQNGILPEEIAVKTKGNQPLNKGLTAYMFCKALNLKGGLLSRIFGLNERYAVKEMVFQDMMNYATANDLISGRELVLIMISAADYLTKNAKDIPQ